MQSPPVISVSQLLTGQSMFHSNMSHMSLLALICWALSCAGTLGSKLEVFLNKPQLLQGSYM